jgi:ATP-dependent exoDNAse (exonuclease V) beta subunit
MMALNPVGMDDASTLGVQARGLRIVSASAGSGKTFRLTQEVTAAVSPSDPSPIPIEGLVAVTYTTKAHAELEARIRHVLVKNQAFERAQELPLAHVGTIHSVALRVVKEFALDAGLSPTIDVISGNEGRRLLQAALEHELDYEVQLRLQKLASRFDFEFLAQLRRYDWVLPVDEIMTLARSNRIDPADLPAMARRSIEGLFCLLRPPSASGQKLESDLRRALHTAIEGFTRLDDDTQVTHKALGELRLSAASLERGRLTWPGWAKLAALAPGKRARELVAPVNEAASAYDTHPQFHAELRELTEKLFEAARVGLVAYARWKAERGLVDYVDMIDRALMVLDIPEVEAELRARLKLVVVDEFQDTSPIQLALFARLHAIAGRSVWVGERKQCIFEYAGADPTLMEAVRLWARANGGDSEILPRNHRSRPELVEMTSVLFSGALRGHGYAEAEVATAPERPPLAELESLPPVGVWWLQGQEDHTTIAEGIVRLLGSASATRVLDRETGVVRPVRAGDVAVLVYSNAEASRVSAALAARGIDTVLPRVGLLKTPEGTFIRAALRLLADRFDTLASAELEALTGFPSVVGASELEGERAFELWLAERIRQHDARRRSDRSTSTSDSIDPTVQSMPDPPSAAATPPSPAVAALERLGTELVHLSPAETLDRVLTVLDVPTLVVRWPDPTQRLSNIEALRALAADYEERCSYQRESASLGGLLRYFDETEQEIRQRDDSRATDEQHVGGSQNAVVISTYHKAKGLEWPVVILGGLHRQRQRDAFEVTPETDRDTFNAADPLGGRWVRYWPWPLGQTRNAPLGDRAAASPVGKAVIERDIRERVRLLYVGFTRARDHLILAIRQLKKGPSKAWLDELADDAGPLLTLPDASAPGPHIVFRGPDGERHTQAARVWTLEAQGPSEGAIGADSPRYWFAPARTESSAAPDYWIAPSSAADASLQLPSARIVNAVRFTRRMPLATPKGITFDEVGNALHAFLAADVPDLTSIERTELAGRLFQQRGLAGAFEPEVAIAAGDALRTFVAERWPDASWHREIPVSAFIDTEHGKRRIAGSIDLLLETPAGFVIIDHKSFPGRASEWEERALGYAPQLMTYAKAIQIAGGKVAGMFVHFLIGGGIVEIGEGAT